MVIYPQPGGVFLASQPAVVSSISFTDWPESQLSQLAYEFQWFPWLLLLVLSACVRPVRNRLGGDNESK